MKPLQTLAILATLVVCLGALAWMARSAPGWLATATTTTSEGTSAKTPPEADAKLQYEKENPFNLAAQKTHPKAEIPEIQYAFGRMVLGSTGEHDFVIRNVGDVPLKLAKGPTQCKCTVAGVKDQEIPPGGEASIHLSWKPETEGRFAQTAIIWTNDPDHAKVVLGVDGMMFPEIVVQPPTGWLLGPVASGKEVPLEGSIYSAIFDNFKITGIESSNEAITLEATPFTEPELAERQAKTGYHLRGKVAASSNPGPIQAMLTVHTDLEKHPKFEFSVSGTRTGALTIIGPHWFAGEHLIDLGKVSSADGKEIKLTVMLQPGPEEMKFTEVQAVPAFVKVRLKPESVGAEVKRERYSLFVEVPKGSPKGIWHRGNPGGILIKTNHPQVPELHVNLIMDVE